MMKESSPLFFTYLMAYIEVVDPIILNSKLVESCDACCCDADIDSVPEAVCCCFDDSLVCGGNKRLYVSLGIFTIIRISRNVQLLIPAYDFCIPDKESECGEGDGPCELFKKFKFPINEFFPPKEEKGNESCCKSSC